MRTHGVMDQTPLRIKHGHTDDPTLELCEPDTIDELSRVVRELAGRGDRYLVVGARSNVVAALDADADAVIATTRLADVIKFDATSQLITVGAGMLGGRLEDWLNDRGFTLGQFPQSLHISTVGGWVATRATGSLSARNGGVERAVRGATIVLSDGHILRFDPRVRPPGGLDGLNVFFGSEGSLGIIAEVTFEVHRELPELSRCFLLPDLASVIEAQRELMQGGYPVGLLRGYNAVESAHVLGRDTGSRCLLMVSTLGAEGLVGIQLDAIATRLAELGAERLDDDAARRWYAERYSVETMMQDRNSEPGRAFDTIEVSVPWSTATECAARIEQELARISSPFYLHFSHAYETGVCFYSLLWLEAADDAAVLAELASAWQQVLDITTACGGTFGHHHGIGSVRADRYRDSSDRIVHSALKDALDPKGYLLARLLDDADGR